MNELILEYSGSALAIVGALLVALNGGLTRIGWACWIVSNLCLIQLFVLTSQHGLLSMQLVFLTTSLLGFKRATPRPSSYRGVLTPKGHASQTSAVRAG